MGAPSDASRAPGILRPRCRKRAVYNAPLIFGPWRAEGSMRGAGPCTCHLRPDPGARFKMDWLISSGAAQATGAPPAGAAGGLPTMLFMGVMIVVFYFVLIRPQSKRAKEHRNMISALEAGAEIVTNGGILGKIVELGESFV